MKKLKLLTIVISFLLQLPIFAQVQIDKQIQLTGTGTDAEITGIKNVSGNQDAVSVDYIQRDSLKFALASGSNNSYSVSLSPAVTGQYTVGMMVMFIANFSNTGPATLNVNGIGARTIKKNYNTDLGANDIQNGQAEIAMYDGTNFQLLSSSGSSTSCSGAPVASGAISGLGTVCQQQTDVVYTIPTMANATGYTWSYSGTGASIVGTGNAVVIYFSASATSGWLSVTGGNACGNSSALTDSITVNATPSSAFTASPSSANELQSVSISTATTGVTYNWTFPSGTPASSTVQSNSVSWGQLGTYNISLTVTGSNGCSSTTISSEMITCHGSASYSYTGGQQTWVAPSCVTSVTIDAAGAAGGGSSKGGRLQITTLPVTPGQTYYVFVGGGGGLGNNSGGYNGGGSGITQNSSSSYGGGGASDLRTSASDLTTRILVAAGGGGCNSGCTRQGGNGGGSTGAAGTSVYAQPAGGGTQGAGGAAESGYDNCSANNVHGNIGSLGNGGAGNANNWCPPIGGGGGAGYYGGGGAGIGGGGGGSDYVINTATGVTDTQGYQSGNGYINITW